MKPGAVQAVLAGPGSDPHEETQVPRPEAIVINCREPASLAPFYADLSGLAVDPADAAAIAAGPRRGRAGAQRNPRRPARLADPGPGTAARTGRARRSAFRPAGVSAAGVVRQGHGYSRR